MKHSKINRFFYELLLLAVSASFTARTFADSAPGTWTPLKNQPTFVNGVGEPLLLTDGSILFRHHASLLNFYPDVWKLTPDIHGSYENGTWSQLASLPVISATFEGSISGTTLTISSASTLAQSVLSSIDQTITGLGVEPGTVIVNRNTDGLTYTIKSPSGLPQNVSTRTLTISVQYAPSANASAVLPDGRVILAGGEYNGVSHDEINPNFAWESLCALYDPIGNKWTSIAPPQFFTNELFLEFLFLFGFATPPLPIGDASSVVLSNGTFMLANSLSHQAALLDPKTLMWSETGFNKKPQSVNDEEGWTLLPNGKVLTINCYSNNNQCPDGPVCAACDSVNGQCPEGSVLPYPGYPYPNPVTNATGSETYNPKTGSWSDAGSTVVTLTDCVLSEIGPAILRPDGTVFATGGICGNTAIYNSKDRTWAVGPKFPETAEGQLGIADGPGALLPNGNVLVAASPGFLQPPLHVLEFDGSQLIPTANIPNAANISSAACSMLVLPTGQILMATQTADVELYTPKNKSFNPDWAPVISEAPKKVSRGNTYRIDGIRFNGMSQGAMYGDDYQSATNYPLVRITNCKTGHVFYCRTHDHSFMGVASNKKVHTFFDVPANIEFGKSKLEVVANGIPSKSVKIIVEAESCKQG